MKKTQGFTLVELVVVILILGILAGVAAPRLINTAGSATDNGLRQTLSIIRDGIETYAAQNRGEVPAAGTFADDIAVYIRGDFPACPVGNENADVAVGTTSVPAGPEGWRFNTTTREFIVNTADTDNSDPAVAYSTY